MIDAAPPADLAGALEVEGAALSATAVDRVFDESRVRDDGGVVSRSDHRVANSGTVLQAWHESGPLRQLAGLLLENEAFPTRSSYIYYPPGGHVGLHTDVQPCRLTLLVPLTSGMEPLVVHPGLRSVPAGELVRIARESDGFPGGGLTVPYARGKMLALLGTELPHHRLPTGSTCSLATLCFDSLF